MFFRSESPQVFGGLEIHLPGIWEAPSHLSRGAGRLIDIHQKL